MNIISISLIRNESDVIELFIRNTLNFVDSIYIILNFSTDNTKEILNKLKDEGFPITIMESKAHNIVTSNTILKVMSKIDLTNVDWVIPLDADEFISAKSREEFEEDLSKVPNGHAARIYWRTYIASKTNGDNPLIDCHHRCENEPHIINKFFIPKSMFTDLYTYPGFHDRGVSHNNQPCKFHTLKTHLNHFSVRSSRHALQKFMIAYYELKCRKDFKNTSNGFQNKESIKILRSCGYEPTTEDLKKCSFTYFHDQEFDYNIIHDPVTILDNVFIKYERKSNLMHNIDMLMEHLID